MGNGYMGKIIRLDLTNHKISYIKTSKYEKWAGGHGMGSAIFFDIAVIEKGLDLERMDHNSAIDGGFNPNNVVTIMTSPFTGTMVPGASGRTEVQGIGVQTHPVGWFTRSNFGGRFGTMLKFAGYDGIVIEGASKRPVWIDIRDNSITIRDCKTLGLWGLDTRKSQQVIWDYVLGDDEYGRWISPENTNDQTTQRPAVLTIGQAGENKSRMACLIHDAGNASGQGGFGGVWGSKNLKAISVIGTGSINVANPQELVRARIQQIKDYGCDVNNMKTRQLIVSRFHSAPKPLEVYKIWTPLISRLEDKRPQGCVGCPAACRARYKSGMANEASCSATQIYSDADSSDIQYEAIDLMNAYGFNAFDLVDGLTYLKGLADMKKIGGPGSEIETDLDFDDYGSLDFIKKFFSTVAKRDTDFGNTLAEGFRRAIEIWGRHEDLDDKNYGPGKIDLPYWGMPKHEYDARCELEWGYGSILGDRDINEHCFNSIFYDAMQNSLTGSYEATAEEAVSLFTKKMVPYNDEYSNPEERNQMLNYADANMYSEHIVRLVAWHRHYTRLYKQSLLFCDFRWPDIVNVNSKDKTGSTGESEPVFFKVVTGKELSFADGIELGRKIWNLDNAIWTLQGRHRSMVHFADYIYSRKAKGIMFDMYLLPTYESSSDEDGSKWDYRNVADRRLVKGEYREGDAPGDDFEGFKTRFYMFEGWAPSSGWPRRSVLKKLKLEYVANVLEKKKKLGV